MARRQPEPAEPPLPETFPSGRVARHGGEVVKCEQELCPFWSGNGCICDVFSIPADDRQTLRNMSDAEREDAQ